MLQEQSLSGAHCSTVFSMRKSKLRLANTEQTRQSSLPLSGLIAPQDSGPICVRYKDWMMKTCWSISLYTLQYPGDKESYHGV
jgi:hypothetical protein